MKFLFLFFLSFFFLYAGDIIDEKKSSSDTNTTKEESSNEPILVIDTSGMSKDEVRKEAQKNDAEEKKKKELDTAIDAMLDGTFNELAKKEKTWEDLSPTPKNYDWIQTKSGEWFKGYIKAMFDKSLEFDSDELDMQTFKFKNITQIKSYQIIGVNIDKVAIFEGIIRMKDDKITIIQGNNKFEFPKSDVVSFANSGKSEKDKWYAKVSISLDWRNGNTKQLDYAGQGTFKRRTAKTRLVFDYLGRYSEILGIPTVNDHRINEKYDIYLGKDFYWTPFFSEYYQDEFRNIDTQFTGGAGIGYMLINTNETEWDITAGPAIIFTNYISVGVNEKSHATSYSAEFSTKYTDELTKKMDFTYSYKFSLVDEISGAYKHHMLAKLENELTSWLDLDFTFVWDYLYKPRKDSDGRIPEQDDYQFLIGLGVEY